MRVFKPLRELAASCSLLRLVCLNPDAFERRQNRITRDQKSPFYLAANMALARENVFSL